MVNGIGVLGWGVGGIEAEAAMLGQPSSMLIPEVIGVRLTGKLAEGATATDLVLTVTEMLRKRGVVEKFVEFFGPGIGNLAAADRTTIANMAPEYGATCGIFPIDEETLNYLRLTGRSDEQIAVVEGLRAGAGHVVDAGRTRGRIHRRADDRSREHPAEPGRSQAPAGPRALVRRAGQLPQGLRGRAEAAPVRGSREGHRRRQQL